MHHWRISIHNHMMSGRRADRYDPVVINLVDRLSQAGFPMPDWEDIKYTRQEDKRFRVDVYVKHWNPTAMTMLLLGLNTDGWGIRPVRITVEEADSEVDPTWDDMLTWETYERKTP